MRLHVAQWRRGLGFQVSFPFRSIRKNGVETENGQAAHATYPSGMFHLAALAQKFILKKIIWMNLLTS